MKHNVGRRDECQDRDKLNELSCLMSNVPELEPEKRDEERKFAQLTKSSSRFSSKFGFLA